MNLEQLKAKRADYHAVYLDCIRAGSPIRQRYWLDKVEQMDRAIAEKERKEV